MFFVFWFGFVVFVSNSFIVFFVGWCPFGFVPFFVCGLLVFCFFCFFVGS